MKRNGFTLVELLVVIAIIGILSVIIVPSIVTVNKNVNERLYQQKVDNIVAAAELYASNNPDIFNGADKVYVYVYQLIDANYLKIDTKYGVGLCDGENENKGCISDPRSEADDTLNTKKILLTKKNVGIVGEFDDGGSNDGSGGSKTLVQVVCEGFGSKYIGMSSETAECNCVDSNNDGVYDTISSGSMCMIVSNDTASGNVDNWLKYGSSTANWRVLGVYLVDGKLYPKMISADAVQ